MRGTKLFEVSIDGHITTRSNQKIADWNDRLETKFSTLSTFPSTRKVAIDAKFWISSKRFRESGALDLDNLIKPVLDKLNHSIPLQLWAVMFRLFPGVLITLFFLMLQKNKLTLLEPLKEKHISLRIFMGATIGTFMALSFWILGYSNIKYPPVASLLGQTSCIFIILLAWIALKESISKKRMAAMAVSIIGVLLVIIGG